MPWTNEQLEAINSIGTNIIVSAGAGSGKTAVLTERIIKHVESGMDIRKLLVLTFTNAAAKEMKARIKSKLIEIRRDDVLAYLDASYITTFDAYSLALVKKYYYKLGIYSDVKIMDSLIINQKKKEIINELFTKLYEEENPRFFSVLSKYTDKDDKQIVELISKILGEMDLLIDIDSYYNNYAEKFSLSYLVGLFDKYMVIIKDCINEIVDKFNKYNDLAESDSRFEKIINQNVSIINYLAGISTYDEYKSFFAMLKLNTLPRNVSEDITVLKKEITTLIKALNERYLFHDSKDSIINDILNTKDDSLFIMELAMKVREALTAFKLQTNCFEYCDIQKMAIKLVTDFKEINKEISEGYDEILVDEYQDTSDLQEAFITAIARNNLYMVGDIKQSIYRFRNANPAIFRDKYDKYSKDRTAGKKIDLRNNFRSRSEVVEGINTIFNSLMTPLYGDADFVASHQMIFGQTRYNEFAPSFDYNMEILKYSKDGSKFSNEEIEAFIVGNDIKRRMEAKEYVVPLKNKPRQINYNDFCILVDRQTSFVTFKKIFEYLGIPLTIFADSDLKNGIISTLMVNFLVVALETDNEKISIKGRHALFSLLRSFLFEYSDEAILTLDISNNDVYSRIKDIGRRYGEISAYNIYLEIVREFNVYDSILKIGDINNNLVQLQFLGKMILDLEALGFGLKDIVVYLVDILASDNRISYNSLDGNDLSVKIMTIHKSKGLEFPICYYTMLSKQFNRRDLKSNYSFTNEYGIFLPSGDGNQSSIIKELVIEDGIHDDTSEKIRLFYVALTRAKEKMIILSEVMDGDCNISKAKSFNEFLSLLNLEKYYHSIDLKDCNLTQDYLLMNKKSTLSAKSEVLTYTKDSFISNPITKSRISKELTTILDSRSRSNIELGLEFHEVLEHLDFANPDIDSIPCSELIKEKLKELFMNPTFASIKNGKGYHEHEFYFEDKESSYHGIIDLMVVYDDHIDIFDYKLANTEHEEYKRQLGIYKDYASKKSGLKVNTYLISLLHAEIKEIEV